MFTCVVRLSFMVFISVMRLSFMVFICAVRLSFWVFICAFIDFSRQCSSNFVAVASGFVAATSDSSLLIVCSVDALWCVEGKALQSSQKEPVKPLTAFRSELSNVSYA